MSRRSNFASTSTSGSLGFNVTTYKEDSRSREKKRKASGRVKTPKTKVHHHNANVYEAVVNQVPTGSIIEETESVDASVDQGDWVDEDIGEDTFRQSNQNKKASFMFCS